MASEERMRSFASEVTACWENMGMQLGVNWMECDGAWDLDIWPLPVEAAGVMAEPSEDHIDLLDIIALFDKDSVECCSVHHLEIEVTGTVDGATVTVRLVLYVPELA